MINFKLNKIISVITIFVMMTAFLPVLSYAAEKEIVYTNSEYTGASDGTKNKPYANFEDAVKKCGTGRNGVYNKQGFYQYSRRTRSRSVCR